MKSFIAIVAWTFENRIAKFEHFDTQEEAVAHVEEYGGFVIEKPSDETCDWLIDPVNKAVVINVLPPNPGPTNEEIYNQVMKNQKVLKAFVLCINDGSIIPGANMSNAALKTAIRDKM